MVNLATLSGSALRNMSQRDFIASLDGMTPEAIERFQSMRDLPDSLSSALTGYLERHPEKRTASGGSRPAPAKARKKPSAPPARKPAPRKAPAKKAKSTFSADDGYIPFPERLKAWWNGTEVSTGEKVKVTNRPSPKTSKAAIRASDNPARRAAQRPLILQRIWGEGFSLPGGAAFELGMAEVAHTQPGAQIAEISAGLCGAAIALAEKYRTRVDCFMVDPQLCEFAGREAGERTPVTLLDKDEPYVGLGKYDRIIGRETLCFMEKRPVLLAQASEAMKPGGEFVFTDLVRGEDLAEPEELGVWKASEPVSPVLWALEQYRHELAKARLVPRETVDISDTYIGLIEAAWRNLMETLEGNQLPPEGVDALMAEGAIWLNRIQALRSGGVQLVRFHTAKKTIRSLSGPG